LPFSIRLIGVIVTLVLKRQLFYRNLCSFNILLPLFFQVFYNNVTPKKPQLDGRISEIS